MKSYGVVPYLRGGKHWNMFGLLNEMDNGFEHFAN